MRVRGKPPAIKDRRELDASNAVAGFHSLFFAFREESEFVSHTTIGVSYPGLRCAAPWADLQPSRWD